MKEKILFFVVAVLLSVNCFGQNRFVKEFSEADKFFISAIKSASKEAAAKADSITGLKSDKYESIWDFILGDTTIFESSVNEVMLSFVAGYINGMQNTGHIEDVNFDAFLTDVILNKESLKSYIKFKNSVPKKDLDVFSNPYVLKIIDEHEVLCVSADGETVRLYFENALRLSDEWCVYIKNDKK